MSQIFKLTSQAVQNIIQIGEERRGAPLVRLILLLKSEKGSGLTKQSRTLHKNSVMTSDSRHNWRRSRVLVTGLYTAFFSILAKL